MEQAAEVTQLGVAVDIVPVHLHRKDANGKKLDLAADFRENPLATQAVLRYLLADQTVA